MSKDRVAWKLHAQFGHPSKSKLLKLVERAGMNSDQELLKKIDHVYKTCQICKEYSKPVPRPVVGLPHATTFNETVALDLKFFEGKIVLHLIDHLTRFSASKCRPTRNIVKLMLSEK